MLAREKSQREELEQGKPKRRQREGKEELGVGKKGQRRSREIEGSNLWMPEGCKWWLVERRERHLHWREKCGKLSSLRSKQPSESLLRMGRQRASGRSNLRRAMPMNKRNGQIAQGSQDLWSMARAKARAIFQKGDITHVMRTIFNAPMSPNQFK